MYKLSIELVPKSCWFSNLRDHLTSSQWENVKKDTFKKAENRCEICFAVGKRWPVECHEVWNYDDKNNIQKLLGTIALCPSCHMVKHIGYASVVGKLETARRHLIKVNQMSEFQADSYIEHCFNIFDRRSSKIWTLDISWINIQYKYNISEKR